MGRINVRPVFFDISLQTFIFWYYIKVVLIPQTNNFHFSAKVALQPLRLHETGARDIKKRI